MFDRNKAIMALEQKRAKFQAYRARQEAQQLQLEEWLERFAHFDYATMCAALAEVSNQWPGALPTPEWDRADRLCIPFAQQWRDHRAARGWALDVLLNRPVAAVDGSQIAPTKDIWPPVGAVQIGWFVNEHRTGGSYRKELLFEILAPDELSEDEDDDVVAEGSFPNQFVNQMRFVRECEKICELMAEYATAPERERPLCFFDGSFIISFAGRMLPRHADPYVRAVQQLLECSQLYRTPVVAFVDRSASRDIVTLMETLNQRSNTIVPHDARLIERCVTKWGDRSPFFVCARADGLSEQGRAPFYQDVVFAYIKLTNDLPPARIELPRWVLDAGRAEEIVDLVRAECVVGGGYPYAIETADAVAVISQQDRQRFYALYQQFVAQEGGALQQTRKALSKQGRR
ncbi:MAG: DNA double-strand break repair nuclease NurA [Caldilineaceae bacterium]